MTLFISKFKKLFTEFRPARLLLYSCALGLPSTSQAQMPTRFPVMPEQVRLAMQKRDWPMAGLQIRLAATVTATVAEPALEIDSVLPQTGHEAMLRMSCRVHSECLPFFALATWPTEASMPDLLTKLRGRSGSGSSSLALQAQIGGSPELLARSSSVRNVPEPKEVRIGSPATLLLEGGRIHIRILVVYAQSGHVGEIVRVTTPDRKQLYVAEVLNPELLRGEIKP